jgi:chaperonin cofactor prefoldin
MNLPPLEKQDPNEFKGLWAKFDAERKADPLKIEREQYENTIEGLRRKIAILQARVDELEAELRG